SPTAQPSPGSGSRRPHPPASGSSFGSCPTRFVPPGSPAPPKARRPHLSMVEYHSRGRGLRGHIHWRPPPPAVARLPAPAPGRAGAADLPAGDPAQSSGGGAGRASAGGGPPGRAPGDPAPGPHLQQGDLLREPARARSTRRPQPVAGRGAGPLAAAAGGPPGRPAPAGRSEEHTSELQSRENLVCRLLLE